MEQYLPLIAQYGFPIVMCLWFMFRTEKIISANTEAINKITDIVLLCPQNNINKNRNI
jgi:hypothetical protein